MINNAIITKPQKYNPKKDLIIKQKKINKFFSISKTSKLIEDYKYKKHINNFSPNFSQRSKKLINNKKVDIKNLKHKINGDEILKHYRKKNFKKRMMLPVEFELLFEKFKASENALALFHSRNKSFVTVTELKNSVKNQIKKKFKKIDLLRIIKILPEGLRLKYLFLKDKKDGWRSFYNLVVQIIHNFNINFNIKNNNNNLIENKKNCVEIQMNSKFHMNEKIRKLRENIFLERLINIVNKQHEIFLSKNKLPKIDPLIYNEWHVNFPLENCKLPDPISVPKIPKNNNNKNLKTSNSSKNFANYVSLTDFELKNKILKKVDFIIENQSVEQSETETEYENLKCVDQKLINKIRNKSLYLETLKGSNKNNNKIKNLNKIILLVKVINEIFITSKKSKINLIKLIDQIKKRNKKFNNNKEINILIKDLINKKTKWCYLTGKSNTIFHINKKIQLKNVLNIINGEIKKIRKENE